MARLTYARLDKLMRNAGFESLAVENRGRRYQHPESGAGLTLPEMPGNDTVLPRHLLAIRAILDAFGHAEPIELTHAFRAVQVS